MSSIEFLLGTDLLAISDVYTTLGCVHSLLPNPDDDYSPPQIPALHPRGFERWQTIQLLMDPAEHAPYLQEAVRKFELVDPQTKQGFREYGDLPRTAFPLEPDVATTEWHENVFLKRVKDNEEKAAEAEEKAKNAKSDFNVPGGGTSPTLEADSIRLDDDIEDNETMKGGLRTPYSTRSGSPFRNKTHSRESSGSYYDPRGRSRSPMPPPKGVDPDRLHAQRPSYTGEYRYATSGPPSDMEGHIHSRSRKNSHIQYLYDNGEARPIDEASVRSVSPSEYGHATTSSHHPSMRGRKNERVGTRGRSAEPYNSYYYNGGYRGHSREDSHSPMRSKSHGGEGNSSNEDLHREYVGGGRYYNGPLPPMAKSVYELEVGMGPSRTGHLRAMDNIPIPTVSAAAADYYQIHTPPHPAQSLSSSSTARPVTTGSGSRGGTHHQRVPSPHDRGHRRVPSGGRGRSTAHSGASSRYQSSTESLIRPDMAIPPVPPLSGTTVPTTTNLPPSKMYQTAVMTDSEDEYAHYSRNSHSRHQPHYIPSPNPSHHRSGSGGASTTAQAGVYKRGSRRDRERERDRGIDNDRMMKMQQMGAGGLGVSGGYEEEVAPGGRRAGFARTAPGGKGGASNAGGGGRMSYVPSGVSAGGVTAGGYSPYVG